MTTATPDTTPNRAPTRLVQEWLAQSGQASWTVPARDVHHVRRALHAALKAACDRYATEAEQMARAAEVDAYARLTDGYIAAIGHHGDIGAVLDLVGWDCGDETTQYTPPIPAAPGAPGSGGAAIITKSPPFQRPISINLLQNLDLLRYVLAREVESMHNRGDDDAASVGALLAELEALVDEAKAEGAARAARKAHVRATGLQPV